MAHIDVSDPGTVVESREPWHDGVPFFVRRYTPTRCGSRGGSEGATAAPSGAETAAKRRTPPRAAVIFLHGFIEHIARYPHVFHYLASRHISTLAFDQRGFGRTGPRHGDTTWAQQFEDVAFAVREERRRLDREWGEGKVKLFLYGHSMGGGISFAFFTRGEGDGGAPPQEVKDMVDGVIMSSPWLTLTNPPPSIAFWLAPKLLKLSYNFPWRAPVNPLDLSSDPAVVEDNRRDALVSPNVYLRSVLGPLLGGPKLVSDDFARWPRGKPLLVAHGEADQVTSAKASETLLGRVDAEDKTLKLWPGLKHECHNEAGDAKIRFLEHIVEWIYAHAPENAEE